MYPNLLAGTRVTASGFAALSPTFVWKTVNTDRTSANNLAEDPELQFQLAPNALYVIEFHLYYAGGPTNALLKTRWLFPTGASGNRACMGPGSLATNTSADTINMRSGTHGYSIDVTYGTRATATDLLIAVERSLMATSAAGLCAIKWCQATSQTTAVRMAAGSWGRATRLV